MWLSLQKSTVFVHKNYLVFSKLFALLILTKQNKILTTPAEINGELFKAYRMQISLIEEKLLMNI